MSIVRMKGGGGTTYSDVKQTTSNLPEYAKPYYQDLLARTGYETSQTYDPYKGQRIANFSPAEQAAMSGIYRLGMSGTPEELNEAGRMAMEAGGRNINTDITNSYGRAGFIGNAGDYDPTSRESGYVAGSREVGFDPGSLADQDALQGYINPYMQNVVDIQKREAARQADQRNASIGGEAAGAGSLGGYREAIMRSENERNLAQQMGDIQLEGSERAYNQAQQAFEADRAARAQLEEFQQGQFGMNENLAQAQEQFAQSQFGMNAQNDQFRAQMEIEKYNAYEQAKQKAAELGLSAQEIEQAGQVAAQKAELEAAGMLGDFVTQRQQMEMERLGAMQQAGLNERSLLQQGLDIGYQDYLDQRDWGKNQLEFYNQMLQGLPSAQGSTQTSTGQGPGTFQQLGGLGIAGAGLYNSMRGGGG